MKKYLNTKVITIAIALIVGFGLLLGYKTFFGPKTVKGAKEITVTIKIEKDNIDKKYTFHTDDELLIDLLENNKDKMQVEITEFSFGKMVTGLEGYQAKEENKEFFSLQVNGKDAQTGPSEIAIQDQDQITFELKTW